MRVSLYYIIKANVGLFTTQCFALVVGLVVYHVHMYDCTNHERLR